MSTNYVKDLRGVKSGDILVWNDSFKGQSRFGALIRIFTASDFTHVGIALRGEDGLYCAEANIPKIQVVKVSPNNRLFYIPTPIHHDEVGQKFLDDTKGMKYSYIDAVRALFGIVNREDERYQCAEYVVDYFREYGVDLGNVYTPSRVVKAAMHKFDSPLIPLYK